MYDSTNSWYHPNNVIYFEFGNTGQYVLKCAVFPHTTITQMKCKCMHINLTSLPVLNLSRYSRMVVLGDIVYFYANENHIQQFNLTMGINNERQFGPILLSRYMRSLILYSKEFYNQYIKPLSNPCGRNLTNQCFEFCFNVNNQAVCKCEDVSRNELTDSCIDNTRRTSRQDILVIWLRLECYIRLFYSDNPPIPVGECPLDRELQLQTCQHNASYRWTSVTWTDDYTPVDRLLTTQPSQPSPVNLIPGIHEFVFTATDEDGNTGVCSYTITVFNSNPATCNISTFDEIASSALKRTSMLCDNGRAHFNVSCKSPELNVTFGSFHERKLTVVCIFESWTPPNFQDMNCHFTLVTTQPALSVSEPATTGTARTSAPKTLNSSTTALNKVVPMKSSSQSKGLSGGAKAGIVIGVVLLLITVVIGVMHLLQNPGYRPSLIRISWKQHEPDAIDLQPQPLHDNR
ncbi:uncharacterized protein LOC108949520 isoform X1 [Ciona intestinalis]